MSKKELKEGCSDCVQHGGDWECDGVNCNKGQAVIDDLISRQAAIDTTNRETVSTNPDGFKANDKFIGFLDDKEISSFGRWQFANGFNMGLVSMRVALDKLPSVQPERKMGKWIYHRPPDDWVMSLYTCNQCGHVEEGKPNFCPNCGSYNGGNLDSDE